MTTDLAWLPDLVPLARMVGVLGQAQVEQQPDALGDVRVRGSVQVGDGGRLAFDSHELAEVECDEATIRLQVRDELQVLIRL